MSSNRASLLAGLRTGGVRSTSLGMPQTAAPTVTSFAPMDNGPMSAALAGAFPNYAVPPPTALNAQDAQVLQLQLMQMELARMQVRAPDRDANLVWETDGRVDTGYAGSAVPGRTARSGSGGSAAPEAVSAE